MTKMAVHNLFFLYNSVIYKPICQEYKLCK